MQAVHSKHLHPASGTPAPVKPDIRREITLQEINILLDKPESIKGIIGNSEISDLLMNPLTKPLVTSHLEEIAKGGNYLYKWREAVTVLLTYLEGRVALLNFLKSKDFTENEFSTLGNLIIQTSRHNNVKLLTELFRGVNRDFRFSSPMDERKMWEFGEASIAPLCELIGDSKYLTSRITGRMAASYPERGVPLIIEKIRSGNFDEKTFGLMHLSFCNTSLEAGEFLISFIREQAGKVRYQHEKSKINEPADLAQETGVQDKKPCSMFSFLRSQVNVRVDQVLESARQKKVEIEKETEITNSIRLLCTALHSLDAIVCPAISPALGGGADTIRSKDLFQYMIENAIDVPLKAYKIFCEAAPGRKYPEHESLERMTRRIENSITECWTDLLIGERGNVFLEKLQGLYNEADSDVKKLILRAYLGFSSRFSHSLALSAKEKVAEPDDSSLEMDVPEFDLDMATAGLEKLKELVPKLVPQDKQNEDVVRAFLELSLILDKPNFEIKEFALANLRSNTERWTQETTFNALMQHIVEPQEKAQVIFGILSSENKYCPQIIDKAKSVFLKLIPSV